MHRRVALRGYIAKFGPSKCIYISNKYSEWQLASHCNQKAEGTNRPATFPRGIIVVTAVTKDNESLSSEWQQPPVLDTKLVFILFIYLFTF